jgi:inner membrane protein
VPTIITHPAIALVSAWLPRLPRRVIVAGAIASIVPDLDVAAFAVGIPYEHMLGHRGLSHSIAFALLFSLVCTWLLRTRDQWLVTFAFVFFCTMSHGVLDAFTDGGLGVAFFAPFHNERYFFPWTPIRVSPIGAGFFSPRGMQTLVSEMKWVWGPCLALGLLGKYLVHVQRKAGEER